MTIFNNWFELLQVYGDYTISLEICFFKVMMIQEVVTYKTEYWGQAAGCVIETTDAYSIGTVHIIVQTTEDHIISG